MSHPDLAFFAPEISTSVRSICVRQLLRLGSSIVLRLAPGWSARQAVRRFITPPKIPHTVAELAALKYARALSISTPAGKLACWQFGASHHPAIIASHGWGGRGAQFREFVPALLDAGFQVWLYDHIGHGLSDGSEAPISDMSQGLHHLMATLESEGLVVAGLIGHSLGATVINLALSRQKKNARALRVVQIAPPASMLAYTFFFAHQFGLPERLRAAMQWRLEQRSGLPWEGLELPAIVAKLPHPALIIHDEQDREVPIANGIALSEVWPNAKLKRTSGLGHRRILQNPDVIHATQAFLSGTTRAMRSQVAPAPAPLY